MITCVTPILLFLAWLLVLHQYCCFWHDYLNVLHQYCCFWHDYLCYTNTAVSGMITCVTPILLFLAWLLVLHQYCCFWHDYLCYTNTAVSGTRITKLIFKYENPEQNKSIMHLLLLEPQLSPFRRMKHLFSHKLRGILLKSIDESATNFCFVDFWCKERRVNAFYCNYVQQIGSVNKMGRKCAVTQLSRTDFDFCTLQI
jgi:hypothetical protein